VVYYLLINSDTCVKVIHLQIYCLGIQVEATQPGQVANNDFH